MTESTTPTTPGAQSTPAAPESTLQEIEHVGIEAVTVALSAGPTLIGDAENVFNDIAHGEGGLAKVTNAIAALETLLDHAKTALTSIS